MVIFLLVNLVVFAQDEQEEKLNSKAVALMNAQKYKEALPVLNDLISHNAGNILFRHNRAVTLSNLARHREALADYKILATALPDESEYEFQIANAYEQLDSTLQAIDFYSRAIETDSSHFFYYFKRGTIYLKQSYFVQAERDFTSSLNLNPYHDNSLHNRGIARYKLGEESKACDDWCAAYQLGNTTSLSHLKKNCKTSKPCSPPK